ncbi:peroxidasin homolog [Montipora capricornis]|uniref:peroxidasin homolog n=1 Tax=Montipora capricornis TaxID=246305 RepID=UPI0035F15D7D
MMIFDFLVFTFSFHSSACFLMTLIDFCSPSGEGLKTNKSSAYMRQFREWLPIITPGQWLSLKYCGPTEIDRAPSNKTVFEYDDVVLHCNATGNPLPNITWTKYGTTAVLDRGNVFTIVNISRHQSGRYQCIASNGVNQTSSAPFVIDVLYGPSGTTIELSPSNTTVLSGSSLSINCTTDANPMAHVFQFYLDDVYIGNSSSGVYTVTVTADGAYTCVPVNTVGKEENATVVISTVYAPSVKVHPTSSVVVEGHNITLTCMASGRPEPVLSWTKVGESGQVLSENSFLVLSNMHRPGTLDNMIQYQCTAENGVENPAFAIANITVHYGPSGTTIELTPSNTTVLLGSSLSINCTTDANPMAHVFQFYLDDVYIGNSSSGVYNVTVTADGAYTCVPVNTVGKEENATVVISTVDVPEPVVIVKADIKDQKVTFAWNKPEENGAAITQYTIYKRNANDQKWTKVAEIKDISNRVFVVEVERMKTYEFVVTATNKYGESSVTKEKIKTVKMPNEGGKYSCSRSYLILIKTIFHVKMIWEINKG